MTYGFKWVTGVESVEQNKKNPLENALPKRIFQREETSPHHCRVERDPLNMYRYMWNLFVCFRLPVKACRPQAELAP